MHLDIDPLIYEIYYVDCYIDLAIANYMVYCLFLKTKLNVRQMIAKIIPATTNT